MAIPAINAQPADMMLMAERHRLVPDNAGAGDIIRADKLGPGPPSERQKEHGPKDGHFGDRVKLRWKIWASMRLMSNESSP